MEDTSLYFHYFLTVCLRTVPMNIIYFLLNIVRASIGIGLEFQERCLNQARRILLASVSRQLALQVTLVKEMKVI